MTDQKEASTKPVEIAKRTYYDPEREAMEQRIRRELAVKHKAGETWRTRHSEEILGILRDPGTPPLTKQLVVEYVNEWEQFDQVEDEIEDNDRDIVKATEAGEPLLRIKFQQYKGILEENRRLRINRLARDKRLLEASKLFPQGVELIPEKEYRDLGTGKVIAGTKTIMKDLEEAGRKRVEKEEEAQSQEAEGSGGES